VVSAP